MNEMTLFLAQVMGPTLTLIGLGIIFNRSFYGQVFKTVGKVDFDMLLTPMIMIPLGIILVMKHFLWGSFPEILISIIGLGILIKGAFLAIVPTGYKSYINFVFTKKIVVPFAGIIWIAGGLYLSWIGFLA